MISSFVITGFLGVGKTTLLINSVQKYFQDKKVAIIVNEFGDIGVDSSILKNVHSEVLEISEGCICCQLATEFESGVMEIIHQYNPEIILVETSGASEPFPIFLSLQNLGINVEGVICVIDSKNFSSYKENSTAKYQLGGSNILVLNKTDLVTNEELEELENELKDIKNQYNIRNTLTGKAIFNNFLTYKCEQGAISKEVFEGVCDTKELIEFAKDYKHLDHTSKDSLTQKVVYIKDGTTFSEIDDVLNNLPQNIYRVKGIVNLEDIENTLIINYSFGDSSFEEISDYKEKSMLIFIGENINLDVFNLDEKYSCLIVPRFSVK